MKILAFSTRYPNAETPNQGIFVETRQKELLFSGPIEPSIIAPLPQFAVPRRLILWAASCADGLVNVYQAQQQLPNHFKPTDNLRNMKYFGRDENIRVERRLLSPMLLNYSWLVRHA